MRTISSVIFILSLSGLAACGSNKAEIDEVCAAECLGKIRTQAQTCGEDQACKQQAMADLKACEARCK